jgi:Fur family transcriptional regulator, zinc uptake regulator
MTNCNNHDKCVSDIYSSINKICNETNLELTQLRKAILKILLETHVPIKAYDIVDKLKTDVRSIKPISVYRILDLFLKHKIVHKIHSLNSYIICSHPGMGHDCSFMICQKCNNIKELCKDEIFEKLVKTTDSHNFHIKDVVLELLGLCSNCL